MSRPSSGTSKRTEARRRLVVSFHDLHPGSRHVCGRFLERLRELGIEQVSLLVVPRWHGEEPISEDRATTAWLREMAARGHDICLHGFFHRADRVAGGPAARLVGRFYTNREGEFYQIDHEMATDRLRRGLHILAGRAGLPVVGFTPPAWLMSDAGRAAVRECGLHYTTTFGQIELLQVERILPAPTLVYSCRSAWRRAVSRLWVRLWERARRQAAILRIAAHPTDFEHPRVEASLYARISRALQDGRKSLTYRDLLPARTPPVHADPLGAG